MHLIGEFSMTRAISAALSISIAVICISANASAERHVVKWAKAGVTYEEYLSDRNACLIEGNAQASTGPAYSSRGIVRSAQPISAGGVASCMMSRGYVEDPSGFAPPDGGVPVYGGSVEAYQPKTPN
jgi:hypothetical protein